MACNTRRDCPAIHVDPAVEPRALEDDHVVCTDVPGDRRGNRHLDVFRGGNRAADSAADMNALAADIRFDGRLIGNRHDGIRDVDVAGDATLDEYILIAAQSADDM